jgi:ceramide glucosyltransferase
MVPSIPRASREPSILLADKAVPFPLIKLLQVVTAAGALAGIGYYLACLWSARDCLKTVLPAGRDLHHQPPVSILKPLKGEDPEIYESFRSHCLQDYPEYELIFGVSDPADPAALAVERLRREFPHRAIQLIVCTQQLGANAKVSNLAQMLRAASYDHLIVSDSDIRVSSDYLRRVVAPLANPNVGVVTCLYRGIAGNTLGSRLESLGISTDFSAGVLVARSLEHGIHFALGSTMAFRRQDLQAIGGFESFVDYLADDYELGKRIAGLGREVCVSELVVDTFLPAYTLRQFLDHQLRWARGVRDARPGGYFGLIFTFGWQWAVLAVLVSCGAGWAWGLLLCAAILRVLAAWTIGARVLKDQQVARFFLLLPLRDVTAVLLWLASFANNTVTWRGDRFQLKNGKLVRLDARQ